jgi:glycosyltransferase involved in cell wall biosynthesis
LCLREVENFPYSGRCMKSKLITVIPVFNGERYILQTLESVARQTVRPDRLVVLDNCSTDGTENVVKGFSGLACEWVRNPKNLGLFGNCNRALEFARETEYLHLLCADDLIEPAFYETAMAELKSCDGLGMAYCLDERIDENNRRLSVSGKVSGDAEEIPQETFLKWKAEIANQAFSGSLLKTNGQESPCRFRLDMPILADVAFWAEWGRQCRKIVRLNQLLCKYRWHGENTTNVEMPGIQALVLDEWKVMQLNEQLRTTAPSLVRRFKLKGLFAVRTGIKARRIRALDNLPYAREIVESGRRISGPLAWYMGQMVVEARDLAVYGLLRRPRHPKNVFS